MRGEFFKILATGLIAGIISPLLLSFLHQRVIWRAQKKIEVKKNAFDEATLALAMYESDTLNVQLQANKPSGLGLTPQTHLRSETNVQMQKSLALVQAFFGEEAFRAYDATLKSNISLNNIPNSVYFEKRVKAIQLMADELVWAYRGGEFGNRLREEQRRCAFTTTATPT